MTKPTSPTETIEIQYHAESIDPQITCDNCQGCCCQLEVMILSETGVPEAFLSEDEWGGQVMTRLDDGWCIAMDRDTYRCSIYENRPWICREFEMGSFDCKAQREQMLGKT